MAQSRRQSSACIIPPVDYLGQLDARDHADLAAISKHHLFRRGQPVFRAGEPGNRVYFLREGRVKIYERAPGGREVILWFCFGGEIFGLAEMARGGGRAVNADACDDSEVLTVTRDAFRRFLHGHPKAAMLSMEVLSARLRDLGDVVVNLVADDVPVRVAKLLQRLALRYGVRAGKSVRLAMPLTHQEIADMIGTSRQTVSSTLAAFKRQGVLDVSARRIRITNEESLDALARAR